MLLAIVGGAAGHFLARLPILPSLVSPRDLFWSQSGKPPELTLECSSAINHLWPRAAKSFNRIWTIHPARSIALCRDLGERSRAPRDGTIPTRRRGRPPGSGPAGAIPERRTGLPPVVKSRLCVASLRCSSVKYVEYSPSSRLGPLATTQFHSVRQTVRRSSRRPAWPEPRIARWAD